MDIQVLSESARYQSTLGLYNVSNTQNMPAHREGAPAIEDTSHIADTTNEGWVHVDIATCVHGIKSSGLSCSPSRSINLPLFFGRCADSTKSRERSIHIVHLSLLPAPFPIASASPHNPAAVDVTCVGLVQMTLRARLKTKRSNAANCGKLPTTLTDLELLSYFDMV